MYAKDRTVKLFHVCFFRHLVTLTSSAISIHSHPNQIPVVTYRYWPQLSSFPYITRLKNRTWGGLPGRIQNTNSQLPLLLLLRFLQAPHTANQHRLICGHAHTCVEARVTQLTDKLKYRFIPARSPRSWIVYTNELSNAPSLRNLAFFIRPNEQRRV